jgi:hypothetical protein
MITFNAPRPLGMTLSILACALFGLLNVASAQGVLSAGDLVATNMNGQHVIGEVMQVRGALADLNLGQNQLARFVSVQDLKVLQHAGTAPQSQFAVGDLVNLPYVAGTVMSGRIMKINGAYCEIDSSQSGFTGWNKCAELSGPGANRSATGSAASAPSKPPKPGFASCAGKFEGRYNSTTGPAPFSFTFRSGKATIKAAFSEPEEAECWISGKQIILTNPGDPNEMPIDINDDGTLDTPFGEVRKKGS